MRIGVISDTHGYLDPRVEPHFQDVAHILHAGDIGSEEIVPRLAALAPVTAVTGNVDWGGPLDRSYSRVAWLEIEDTLIYVTHIGGHPAELVERLPQPRPHVFVYGHSHIPAVETLSGVLFLNPGAAGKPRFGRRPSIAMLELGATPDAHIIML